MNDREREVQLQNASIENLFEMLRLRVHAKLGIDSDAYLDKTGRLVCEERNWRHGSIGTDLLDPNPPLDVVTALTSLENLKKILRTAV